MAWGGSEAEKKISNSHVRVSSCPHLVVLRTISLFSRDGMPCVELLTRPVKFIAFHMEFLILFGESPSARGNQRHPYASRNKEMDATGKKKHDLVPPRLCVASRKPPEGVWRDLVTPGKTTAPKREGDKRVIPVALRACD